MKKIILVLTAMLSFISAGCSDSKEQITENPNENGGNGNGNETVFSTQLGANFNENIDEINDVADLIYDSRIQWVRSFVQIAQNFLKKNNGVITGVKDDAFDKYTETQDFIKVKTASDNKVKLIMSLKIPFGNFTHNVPAKDSKEMGYVIEACRKFLVLHNLGSHIDILVMGNEPMWENGGNEENYRDYLNVMASELAEWKETYGWNFKVFAGALNRVSLNAATNPLIPVVINEVNDNPLIDGLDLHIHALDVEEIGNTLKMVREDFKMKKEIIVTEFSMVWLYNKHVNDNLGQWGKDNGYTSTMKMYEWLNNAIDKAQAGNPISQEEFASFFDNTDWYAKNWFRTFYDEFVKHEVLCATGRFSCVLKEGGNNERYTSSSTMWDLNAIYSSKLLGVNPSTGLMNPSPLAYPDYKGIIDKQLADK